MLWSCTAHSRSAHRPRRRRLQAARLAAGLVLVCAVCAGSFAHGQSGFPFGRELIMDVAPVKGSKRLPTLDIYDDGLANLDLWCVSVKTRLIVVANTITVLTGPKTERPCAPSLARGDEQTLATLAQVTTWRLDADTLVLSGGPSELRFRLQTN